MENLQGRFIYLERWQTAAKFVSKTKRWGESLDVDNKVFMSENRMMRQMFLEKQGGVEGDRRRGKMHYKKSERRVGEKWRLRSN